ncbi:undecaprenyl-phosphate galactose phosphotransferase WbaP [Granulicella arctica]|uniref:Undecaprenyl-phosphate galactose phosphotransferase WbaP n=1 Tax=Granulicella arctica TaxID=940613 RepID=A0A7Y9PIU9_9BACT|nr:undecaprenyl-phosphate galactose phosphotransferase WbaP [Granulicella arctica]NYF79926.1 Undecaprenyl-phosphate galactose phosphotransferase WbaP [Granulicella arctica]
MSTATISAPSVSSQTIRVLHRYLTLGSIVIADLLALMSAGALAVVIRYLFHAQYTPSDWLSFLPGMLIFFFVFAWSGLYPGIATNPIEEFRLILRSSSIGFLLLIGATVFLRQGIFASRIVFLMAWAMTMLFVPVSRRLVRGWAAGRSWWGIPTVILGEAEAGAMMLKLLEGHARVGLRPVALLVENSREVPLRQRPSKDILFGDLKEAQTIARMHQHCYAVLAMPKSGSERVTKIFNECADLYRNVLIIPDLFGMRSLSVSAKDICGVLALEVDQKLAFLMPQLVKRCFDMIISATVALLLLPVFLFVYVAVKLTSAGPAFYTQTRIGRNEEPFRVRKFRSMVVDADQVLRRHLQANLALQEEWSRDHKLKRDPRVTRIGRILRKTSLDELPQLWNVLCGEMSLVGPRPIVESEIEKYGTVYRQYQRVTPGVTGLWQISGRNNTTYEMRTRLDDYYVRNWSLSLDIYILLRTLKTIFLSEGAY